MIKIWLPAGMRLMETAQAGFAASEHVRELVFTGLLSMVPTFEGRYAVTIMLGLGMPMGFAYLFALLCSTFPVPFILLLLRPVLDWFYTLPIPFVRKFAAWLEKRSDRKHQKMHEKKKGLMGWLKNHVSAETMELIGLYIFVALPLPGTGVWTGSAIASLFRMHRGKAALAIILGNITACAIMTLAATGVISIF